MNDFDAFADELHAVMVGKVDPTQFGSMHGLCRFNTAIMCAESDCARCGWNPAVDKQRKAKVRERMAKEAGSEQ